VIPRPRDFLSVPLAGAGGRAKILAQPTRVLFPTINSLYSLILNPSSPLGRRYNLFRPAAVPYFVWIAAPLRFKPVVKHSFGMPASLGVHAPESPRGVDFDKESPRHGPWIRHQGPMDKVWVTALSFPPSCSLEKTDWQPTQKPSLPGARGPVAAPVFGHVGVPGGPPGQGGQKFSPTAFIQRREPASESPSRRGKNHPQRRCGSTRFPTNPRKNQPSGPPPVRGSLAPSMSAIRGWGVFPQKFAEPVFPDNMVPPGGSRTSNASPSAQSSVRVGFFGRPTRSESQ